MEGGFTSILNCRQCENGQGGDIADDRLPKAELWWADRGAEAEGKKKAILTHLTKKLKLLPLDHCTDLFL